MNEADIRRQLIEQLAKSPAGVDAAFISEMFLADYSRRADLIMANGKLSVFEIKSGRDNLERLDGQLTSYLKYFEQVTVVCAMKHLKGVLAAAPKTVGVWSVSDSGMINVERKGKILKVADKQTWLSFLPVAEIKSLLRESALPTNGNREKLVSAANQLSLMAVREYVLLRLKMRDKRIAAIKERKNIASEQIQKIVQARETQLERLLRLPTTDVALGAIPRRLS